MADRVLKTQKGSAIRRSRKFGVGKDIGGSLYFHRQYRKDVLPEPFLEISSQLENYNIIRWDYKLNRVAFYSSEEFDFVHEPVAGSLVMYDAEGGVLGHKTVNQIWHHKWLWVKDNYQGFDVQESFERSREWLALPDIPFSRIGKKSVWVDFLKSHGMSA